MKYLLILLIILLQILRVIQAVATLQNYITWSDPVLDAYIIDELFGKYVGVFEDALHSSEMTFEPDFREDILNATRHQQSGGFVTRNYVKQMQNSKVIKSLKGVVKILYKAENIYISDLYARIVERGDFHSSTQYCRNSKSTILAIVFLNKDMKKNDYGDVALYNESDEIAKSVYPRSGRVLFVRCNSKIKLNPPSLGDEKRFYMTLIEFTTEKVLLKRSAESKQSCTEYLSYVLPKSIIESLYQPIDPTKYLTRTFNSSHNNKVLIFDDVFPKELVTSLFDFVINKAAYTEQEIEIDSEDNVRWILGLYEPLFIEGPIWAVLKQLLQYATGVDTYHPYDVSVNHIRRTDSTTIHKDCNPLDNEFTNLIYLNPDWSESLYGETIYLDDNDEFIGAVAPRFGRLVVFEGQISHSARPPSPNIHGRKLLFNPLNTSIALI